MKILYYDAFAGISGDMNLGALIDLGVDPEYLRSELKKLNIKGFHLEIKTAQRRGITGTKAEVIIENQENEKHRHLRHIEELVNQSSLPDDVKKNALKIFDMIAEAEAKVHNISKQQVHFHEVGALDSIADIVGAAICLDYLKADRIISSPVQLGGGTVKCAHGIMPVPAPATAEILKNIPVRSGLVNYEATTPTGAAILAAMVNVFSKQPDYPVTKIGYGIGSKDTEVPNVLRVMLCESEEINTDIHTAETHLLESNIDDMNPEHYDYILEKLFKAGAEDAWLVPVIMKKSRPANTLSVLCNEEHIDTIKEIIFLHTSTIGIREHKLNKSMLKRKESTLKTPYGIVRMKESFYQGKRVKIKPEFEDCRNLAEKNNVSIAEIENSISKILNE